MPRTVAILYYNVFDAEGIDRRLGGVETYLQYLAELILERGDIPILVQPASIPFERFIGGVKVIGVPRDHRRLRRNVRRDLYSYATGLVGRDKGAIVFGADHASVRTRYPRTVSIQHGVVWDLPGRLLGGGLGRIPLMPDRMRKSYSAYRGRLYFDNCPNRVCVDYNFLNWYRTQVAGIPAGNIWVIPNCVEIPNGYRPNLDRHDRTPVRILFARRFVEYRGSRMMIEAARRILLGCHDVEVCFAGEGPDECLIAQAFKDEPRVTICKYLPDESLRFHESFHVAVVPSLASEGTSLSLAEAMAAGCAVIASNVGGMTNMVIDGYNGRLIDPNVECFVGVLTELVEGPGLRALLGRRAAETAREAFSLERWKTRWSMVLDTVQSAPLRS
jgi:glycosyltransferase involved in cell wall biosynthesis